MRKVQLWVLAAIFAICSASVFTSCTSDNDDNPVVPTDEVEAQLQRMTLREKVGQMIFVRPEDLDTTIHWNTFEDLIPLELQGVNDRMRGVDEKYPVGGIILYAVVKAVQDGTISEQRIDQSVRRILRLKRQMGR